MRGALLAIAFALLMLGAGCGGDDEPSAANDECESVEAPAPREPGEQRSADRAARRRRELRARVRDELRIVHGRPRHRARARTRQHRWSRSPGTASSTTRSSTASSPTSSSRAAIPPRQGAAGPGTARSMPRLPARSTSRESWPWRRPASRPAGTSGSQFFVVTGDDVGLPRRLRDRRRGDRGIDTVERIGALGGPDERPTQPVVISSVTVTES